MQGLHAYNMYDKGITNGGRKKQKYNTMKEKIISEEKFARLKIHIVELTTKMNLKKGKATSNNRGETVQCVFLFSKSMDSKLDLKNQIKNKDHLGQLENKQQAIVFNPIM